ncbi:MAG: cell division protein [Oligoflexia bacterium]|nr:cell division protein [Oligoflexia bacterium]
MKSRIIILVILFATGFGIIAGRAFFIQVLPHHKLTQLRKSQYLTVVTLSPQRGKIVDRAGEDLANSIMAHSLYADPSMIKEPRRLAVQLAGILGVSVSEIREKLLLPKRKFVWIQRRLEPQVVARIQKLKEPGLGFIEESKRAYPNLSLASQILGFTGSDGEGLEGIERQYNAELKGEKKSILSRRDARGRPLLVNGQLFEVTQDGAQIETTLDKQLQYELEYRLSEVVQDQNADKALGIIMSPNTGEILAMASYPSFEPTDVSSTKVENRRNRCVTDSFEPGSTFKLVTLAAALKTGRYQPNSKFFCEMGKLKIGKRTIREAETDHKYGWLTMAEILQFSSNIGTAKIALEVGQEGFERTIKDFGFLSKSGIDFPGEVAGLAPISSSSKWSDHLVSNLSFGHGIGVTALQIANAYSAVANGGALMRPYLVKRIVDSESQVIESREPQVQRRILTKQESGWLTMMLSGVTESGGTGKLAKVDGYPVAGKTGTAQKVNPNGRGYSSNSYVSSFVGFVPANQPQFTIFVMVDNPRKNYYGAQVAAPVFNKLASFALHKNGFMPIVVAEEKLTRTKPSIVSKARNLLQDQEVSDLGVPDFTGLTVREVAKRISRYAPQLEVADGAEFIGSGKAVNQWPQPGTPWSEHKKIRVYFK